jgi:hypothetical protein
MGTDEKDVEYRVQVRITSGGGIQSIEEVTSMSEKEAR